VDTADAYAIVVHKGVARYTRFHRRLGLDRMNMNFGPLAWQIIEPFKTWKLSLADNPHGISYELHWHDTKRPVFSTAMGAVETTGRHEFPGGSLPKTGDHVGYEGFGVVEGWVVVDGQRYELDTVRFNGSRDHHWGIRDGVGGIGTTSTRPEHAGQWVGFKNWSLWGAKMMHPIGSERAGAGRIQSVNRKLRFDKDTGEFREGVFTNIDSQGKTHELHFRRLGYQSAYLRCGGYGHSTPDGGGTHGIYPGQDTLYGGCLNLNDVAVRRSLGHLTDHHCEVSCGNETTAGLLECYEPFLRTSCEQGRPGFAFMEGAE
jgi:hypothetical protein